MSSKNKKRNEENLVFSKMFPDVDYVRNINEYLWFVRQLRKRKIYEPIFPSALKYLFTRRIEAKKKAEEYKGKDEKKHRYWKMYSKALKVPLVASYGVSGYRSARFFVPEFFNTVTCLGEFIIKFAMRKAEEKGYKVIYGDTDSLFVLDSSVKKYSDLLKPINRVPKLVEEINRELKDFLTQRFDIKDYFLSLKLEKIYSKIIFTGRKKRYVGRIIFEDGKLCKEEKFDVTGFELKRSDNFELLKDVQRAIVDILMDTDNYSEALIKIRSYILGVFHEMLSGKLDKKLVIRTQLGRELKEYKAKGPHVRVAEKLKKMGKLRSNTIEWVITGRVSGKLIAEPVDPDTGRIPRITRSGYQHYYERILKMVQRIINIDIAGTKKIEQFLAPKEIGISSGKSTDIKSTKRVMQRNREEKIVRIRLPSLSDFFS